MNKELNSELKSHHPNRNLISKRTMDQLIRYLITGFTAFGIEYVLYVLLYKVLHVDYVLASMIVYSIVFGFSFLTNRKWTFQSTGNIKKQTVQYGLLFAFNLIVSNLFLLRFFTETLGISALLSPFFKMACVVCWNFFIYKYIIYKNN